MASEQVMLRPLVLAAVLVLLAGFAGCAKPRPPVPPAPRLVSPYAARQVWAVVPLRNESGSLQADGARIADRLAQQLELVDGIDVLPVNRVFSAMQSLNMHAVASPQDATRLRQALSVDALVVGTLSAFDPYDPPKLGMAVELYTSPREPQRPLNLRGMSHAAVEDATRLRSAEPQGQPMSVVSVFLDAADPQVRGLLEQYAVGRGREPRASEWREWRMYRISMDLYTEFVSYTVSSRLLRAERLRLKASSPEPLS